MARILTLAVLPVVFVVLLLAPAAQGSTAPAVHVSGNRLIDAQNNPLRLVGVDRSGSEYACVQGWGFFDGPVDGAAITAIASWHANVVRLPLNEDCWLGMPGVSNSYGGVAYRRQIVDAVARLHGAGLAVILDLHWSAPGTQLATGQARMADTDHAPDFWRSVATQFRDDPSVLFDLFNEPHDISDACWRNGCSTTAGWQAAGMQQLLDVVRSTGSRQPVIATANGWGNDASGWLAHIPYDPLHQLVAGVHIYNFTGCSVPGCWTTQLATIAANVPLVTGELGENDCDHTFVDRYMNWADATGVSYLAWSWNTADCSGGPALLTAYDGTATAFGAGFRDRLAVLAAAGGQCAPAVGPDVTSTTPSLDPPVPVALAPAMTPTPINLTARPPRVHRPPPGRRRERCGARPHTRRCRRVVHSRIRHGRRPTRRPRSGKPVQRDRSHAGAAFCATSRRASFSASSRRAWFSASSGGAP